MEEAKAENQAALTARIQAETALLQLQAELQQAILQAQADGMIAEYEAAVARAQAQVAEAEQRAAEAQVALQEAMDALAAQVNETAQEYLALYQSTMSQANNKLEEIVQLEGQIARFNAYLDENGNVVDFEAAAAELNVDIAEDEAQIAALEATLARLEALTTDAASVEAERMEVQAELDEAFAARAVAELEADLASNTRNAIGQIYSSAQNLYNNITFWEEEVANYTELIAQQEENVTSLENQLAPFEAELEATADNYLPAIDEAEALVEVWAQAKAEFDAVAINNEAGDAVYDDALLALTEAQEAFEAYAGSNYPENPQWLKDQLQMGNINYLLAFADPASEFGEIITQYTNVLNNSSFQTLRDRLAFEVNRLGIYENNQNVYLSWIDSSQEQLASLYEEYEVADFTELEAIYMEAIEDYQISIMAYNEINAEVNSLLTLRNTLQNYLNSPQVNFIKNQIANIESNIEFLENNIEANEAALVNNEISAEEWAATIVRTQEKIDRLMVEYNALLALADEFLEQFNEVMED
jgi:chromosome segregation ATPase